jgi:4-hydroxythreonine-4-phosphate dehydrogenase
MQKIKVAITHGDINGVGYEVILKTFSNPEMLGLCTPVIYGSPKVAIYHRNAIGLQENFNVVNSAKDARDNQINLVNCFGEEEIKIEFGKATPEGGKAAYVSLETALKDIAAGFVDVLVTAPINKNTIQRDGFHFPGHTEYIEQKLGKGQKALMILMNENIRVALVTTHVPVAKIAQSITQPLLEEKLQILNQSLKRDFSIDNPRIAVLSLNPHCGDDGLIGEEEKTIINPVVENCFKQGIRCFGPYAADGFFGSGNYKHFDAILAMYHDQGLAPFKALAMDDGVNYTAGLPVVRTSPAHGTAYDIAGKNEANEASFRQAVYTAIDVFRNRAKYDEAYGNPLRKQYYEKRDDSDKLKLDQVTEDDI